MCFPREALRWSIGQTLAMPTNRFQYLLSSSQFPCSSRPDLWPDAPYILLIGCLSPPSRGHDPPSGRGLRCGAPRIIAPPTSSWSDTLLLQLSTQSLRDFRPRLSQGYAGLGSWRNLKNHIQIISSNSVWFHLNWAQKSQKAWGLSHSWVLVSSSLKIMISKDMGSF